MRKRHQTKEVGDSPPPTSKKKTCQEKKPVCNKIWSSKAPPPFPHSPPFIWLRKNKKINSPPPLGVSQQLRFLCAKCPRKALRGCVICLSCSSVSGLCVCVCLWYAHGGGRSRATKTSPPIPLCKNVLYGRPQKVFKSQRPSQTQRPFSPNTHLCTCEAGKVGRVAAGGVPPMASTAYRNRYATIKKSTGVLQK